MKVVGQDGGVKVVTADPEGQFRYPLYPASKLVQGWRADRQSRSHYSGVLADPSAERIPSRPASDVSPGVTRISPLIQDQLPQSGQVFLNQVHGRFQVHQFPFDREGHGLTRFQGFLGA